MEIFNLKDKIEKIKDICEYSRDPHKFQDFVTLNRVLWVVIFFWVSHCYKNFKSGFSSCTDLEIFSLKGKSKKIKDICTCNSDLHEILEIRFPGGLYCSTKCI